MREAGPAVEKAKARTEARHAIANAAALVMTALLGLLSVLGAMEGHGVTVAGSLLFTVILLALLVFAFQSVSDYSKLAFYTPFIVFTLNSMVLATNPQHAYFYLLACIFIFAVSCLHTNFPQTLAYAALQTASVLLLFLLGFPVAGPYTGGIELAAAFLIFFSTCFFLLAVTKSTTAKLNKATEEASSFRTYLATTKDYLAMLDGSNRIVYVSKPLSDLARIGDPELTKGRPFVDLFPGRELKLLAHKMLGQRDLYEEDWEFVLNRQKRYFKAVSSGMAEGWAKGGTLITLLDMTYLAERDEIAAMRDSLKIGIFFMDKTHAIQDNYSRHLEELLSSADLRGKAFTDLLAASLAPKELDAVRDYLDMVFDRAFDAETLREINPLHELHYVDAGGFKKIFRCELSTVELGKGETIVLVTIYDITANVELQERLQREEKKRQEEMSNLFELLQVEPATFDSFQEDVEHEFKRIDGILGNAALSAQEALVDIYQAVHAVKSNAVTLGLRNFGAKAHEVEAEIKKLRNIDGDVPFDDMLHLTIEIERLIQEKDNFKAILEKINAFKVEGGEKSAKDLFLESLSKTAEKVAADTGKKVAFAAADIEEAAIENGPKRVMKEVLMQLVRNSVVHGVEAPEERAAAGKSERGSIRLSVRQADGKIHIRLGDDGRGLDFGKIRDKALSQSLIRAEDSGSKSKLLAAIFAPGFSTADDEEGMHAGRGIGLNLVRDWVRNAGGAIKLQTESGKGTVFNIFFPAGPGPKAAGSGPKAGGGAAPAGRRASPAAPPKG